jgi:hypothetical protein
MPFVGSNYYHPAAANEADRQEVNEWIRLSGHFDAMIDFDKITRDPEHPDRLLPAFDSGDHLHPSPAGYAAMARAVPLSLFAPSAEPAPKIAITLDDLPGGPAPAVGVFEPDCPKMGSPPHFAPGTFAFNLTFISIPRILKVDS